jgi:hypothetical protein
MISKNFGTNWYLNLLNIKNSPKHKYGQKFQVVAGMIGDDSGNKQYDDKKCDKNSETLMD